MDPASPPRARLRHDERGDIISGWLVRLLVVMGVIGLLGYEGVTIGLNAVSVEDAAQNVAREVASAYREQDRSTQAAEQAAEAQALMEDVEVEQVDVEGDAVIVTVSSTADTLFLHRIGLFDSLVRREATRERRWQQ